MCRSIPHSILWVVGTKHLLQMASFLFGLATLLTFDKTYHRLLEGFAEFLKLQMFKKNLFFLNCKRFLILDWRPEIIICLVVDKRLPVISGY